MYPSPLLADDGTAPSPSNVALSLRLVHPERSYDNTRSRIFTLTPDHLRKRAVESPGEIEVRPLAAEYWIDKVF